jgi:hypothetical protein
VNREGRSPLLFLDLRAAQSNRWKGPLKKLRAPLITLAREYESAILDASRALASKSWAAQQAACVRFVRAYAAIYALSAADYNSVGLYLTDRARFCADDVAAVLEATEALDTTVSRASTGSMRFH